MLLDARIGTLAYVPGQPVIEKAALRVEDGERVVLVGPASSGKSSLLAACAGIVPRLVRPAQFEGEILLDGRSLALTPSAELFERVGVVLQALDDQLFDLSTEDLLAFPLENRGVEHAAIRAAVREIAARVGVTRLFGRRVLTLSGGERRLVALGAALVAQPRLLVLDEPMTGLDPEARARFATALAGTKAVGGVLIAEQEVEALAPLVDRVLFQDAQGRIIGDQPAAAAWRADWSGCGVLAPFRSPDRQAPAAPGRGVLQAEGLVSRLARADGAPVLQGLDLTVREGEVVGLIGRNGAGKTTLFRLLLGLAEARAGHIVLDGEEAGGWAPGVRARRIGYLPQNARRLFFNLTLLEEVAFSLAPGGAATPELRARAASLLGEVGLAERAEASPFALSPREQARLGLACLLAAEPRLAILDEPTLGRDQGGLAALASFLGRRRAAGSAVLFASHDLRLVDAFCDRLLILHEGRIAFDGPVRQGWRSGAFTALGWPAPHADEVAA